MMSKRLFLSCATNEFGSYRSVLANDLCRPGLEVEKQESFMAYGAETLLMLDDYIRSCDYIVHIAGDQTGSVASDADRNALVARYGYSHFEDKLSLPREFVDSLSYTQWEAWLAVLHERKLFICTPNANAQRDSILEDPVERERQQQRQQSHLQYLEKQGRYAEHPLRFPNASRLSVALLRALQPNPTAGSSKVVVPKGLRQFDKGDAGFFLSLLPGPFYEGLPECVRFWKNGIESDHPPFSVGALLGTSGSGKSSLFKAGVIPLLDKTKAGKFIDAVFFQASFRDTEPQLLSLLKSRLKISELKNEANLADFFRVYLEHENATKRKLVIVLDQFEQWLQLWNPRADSDLIDAFKQCDGTAIQVVLLVRDDFYTKIRGFMDRLEKDLTDENSLVLELFDLDHAKKVLIAFGQAYDRIEETPTTAQLEFVDNAVAGLASENKNEVICVRLSVFAYMMKSRPWNMDTWKDVGGVEGLGVKFLEESIGQRSSENKFARHREGAKAALRCLLPERDVAIKTKVSAPELQRRSGYEGKNKEFGELMQILNNELRLIAPTDGETDTVETADEGTAAREQYFQLTHDFLIAAVRDWLALTQKESRKGRAMLLLESRSAAWHVHRERRALPTMREYCVIRWQTEKSAWSEKQRQMMREARSDFRLRVIQLLTTAGILVAIAVFSFLKYRQYVSDYEQSVARSAVNELQAVQFSKIETPMSTINRLSNYADPVLQAKISEQDGPIEGRIRCAMAVLQRDPKHKEFLYAQLLDSRTPIHCFKAIKQALKDAELEIAEQLRTEVASQSDSARYCRALFALPEDDQIATCKTNGRAIANLLTGLSNEEYALINDNLDRGAVWELRNELVSIYESESQDPAERSTAASILTLVPATDENFAFLVPCIFNADSTKSFKALFNALKRNAMVIDLMKHEAKATLDRRDSDRERGSRKQAIASIVLAFLEEPQSLWDRLNDSAMHRFKSHAIHLLASLEMPDELLIERLEAIFQDPARSEEVSALLQGLGEYGKKIEPAMQQRIADKLAGLMKTTKAPNLFGASEWLLRRWQLQDQLQEIIEFRKNSHATAELFYVNSFGQSFVGVDPRESRFKSITYFRGDKEPGSNSTAVYMPTDNKFWFAAHEVTCEQWQMYLDSLPEQNFPDQKVPKRKVPDQKLDKSPWQQPILNGTPEKGKSVYPSNPEHCPIVNITRLDALRYCNWLSRLEGLEEAYTPSKGSDLEQGFKLIFQANGYRLPLQHEWEFASRAGSDANRFYGDSDRLLANYAWCNQSPATGKLNPVGRCKPNSLGIFDTLGNAMEWCHGPVSDKTKDGLYLRGAAYLNLVSNIDYKYPKYREPTKRDYTDGIRLARTISPANGSAKYPSNGPSRSR